MVENCPPETHRDTGPKQRSGGAAAYLARESAELALLIALLVIVNRFAAVPIWILIGAPLLKLVVSSAFYALFARKALRRPASNAVDSLFGTRAKAVTPLCPAGQVKANGEIWSALSIDGRAVAAQEGVTIVGARGHMLLVSQDESEDPSVQPRAENWNRSGPR